MVTSKTLFFIFALLALISLTYGASFESCTKGESFGKLNKIEVKNCGEDNIKCPFNVGQNVSMELTFETLQDLETAKIKIEGILTSIPVPFRINPDTVCNYGAKCPLKKNESNSIFLQFPIKQTYPKINLIVRVQLIGPGNESIVCVKFPAQIV